jgi:hypothetical protein
LPFEILHKRIGFVSWCSASSVMCPSFAHSIS